MFEKKEENGNHITLYDFLSRNMLSESVSSTIHRSAIRQRSSLPIKCTVRKSKKKSTLDSYIESTRQLPIRGQRYKTTESKRLYESLLYVKEKETNQKTIKKVFLSELTGRSNVPISRQTNRQQNDPPSPSLKKTSSTETSFMKIPREVGYASKQRRALKTKQTMSEFFGNYQRLKFKRLDQNLMETIRGEVVRRNASNFKLLQ